ncbi:hypothetical protein Syun_024209 [Stephania yunnanensis]|uniref:C2 domain-containing protein n=1 Tax=Stephania yunnanensis TaxID=152371 RepID=A0AAP0FJN5_9MAGN
MGKLRMEICILSARGLGRSSSLWKHQWHAVGWVDPNNKYCTKIDSSGSGNPTWKTKFTVFIDDDTSDDNEDESNALHIQVYSRDPIFLHEKLQGTTIVALKEFLDKHTKKRSSIEEVGSFQLRKQSSGKPQGFVDVSIRIFEHLDGGIAASSGGDEEGFKLAAVQENGIPRMAPGYSGVMELQDFNRPSTAIPSPFFIPIQPSSIGGAVGPSYHHQIPNRVPNPPPLPPPSHVGCLPTFLPGANQPLPSSYINLPSASTSTSSAPPHNVGVGPAFGMGVGAGALAGGAVIFGDDFMSGFNLPPILQDASITLSTDVLF